MGKAKTATPIQTQPEIRVNGSFGGGMKSGFLLRGSIDRARGEIEDHLRIAELIESNEYKQIVAEASETVSALKRLEPLDAFLKLVGTSKATFSRRDSELKALGVETVSQLRGIGIPWKEVRLLADSPEALRKEVRKKLDQGEATRDVVDAILGKLLESEEARRNAKNAATRAEREKDKTQEKLRKARDKSDCLEEDVKTLKSELKEARDGNLTRGEVEIADAFKLFQKRMFDAFGALHGIDMSVPKAMMHAEKVMNELIGQAQAVRASYIEYLD